MLPSRGDGYQALPGAEPTGPVQRSLDDLEEQCEKKLMDTYGALSKAIDLATQAKVGPDLKMKQDGLRSSFQS